MKSSMGIILIAFTITTSLYAQSNLNISNIQEFYYNQGYKQGYNIGYSKGYRDAIKDVLRRLKKYNKKMSAIEASKYLMITGKVTYPQVYRIQNSDGSYKILFTKPKIEKKLSIYDLILIPKLNNQSFIQLENNNKDSSNSSSYKDAFHLQNEKYQLNTPLKRTISLNNQICLKFPKLPLIKKILIASGKPFIEGREFYTIEFDNKNELESFCKNIGGNICQKYAK